MEEKQPVDWKQMVIMTVLIGITAWAAMNFMSKQQQQALPDKPAAADKSEKQETTAQPTHKNTEAVEPAAAGAQAALTSAEPADDQAQHRDGTPQAVIKKAVELYDDIDVYSLEFHLTQPRQPKDAGNPDALERLRETYHLDWKKSAANSPDKDSFRVTGVHGFNKCTVAAFTPDEQKFYVYHPHGKTVTVSAGDPRMTDLFETGVHVVARHLQRLIQDPANVLEIKKESMRLPGRDMSAEYYAIKITKKDDSQETAALNAETGALEMHEMYNFNKKGKTESQRYRLARRVVWFDLKPVSATPAASWYVRKPDFKKLNCSR